MKAKKELKESASRYMAAVLEKYPEVEIEAIFEAVEGHDLLVRVEVPAGRRDSLMHVLDLTTDLNERFWRETGISVTATVVDKEAAFSS